VIVGADDVAVMDQAVRHFGSGNFIFRRIGYSYVDKLALASRSAGTSARVESSSPYVRPRLPQSLPAIAPAPPRVSPRL
jgi:hypothetical protein